MHIPEGHIRQHVCSMSHHIVLLLGSATHQHTRRVGVEVTGQQSLSCMAFGTHACTIVWLLLITPFAAFSSQI